MLTDGVALEPDPFGGGDRPDLARGRDQLRAQILAFEQRPVRQAEERRERVDGAVRGQLAPDGGRDVVRERRGDPRRVQQAHQALDALGGRGRGAEHEPAGHGAHLAGRDERRAHDGDAGRDALDAEPGRERLGVAEAVLDRDGETRAIENGLEDVRHGCRLMALDEHESEREAGRQAIVRHGRDARRPAAVRLVHAQPAFRDRVEGLAPGAGQGHRRAGTSQPRADEAGHGPGPGDQDSGRRRQCAVRCGSFAPIAARNAAHSASAIVNDSSGPGKALEPTSSR